MKFCLLLISALYLNLFPKTPGAKVADRNIFKQNTPVIPLSDLSGVKSAFSAFIFHSEKWRGISRTMLTGMCDVGRL